MGLKYSKIDSIADLGTLGLGAGILCTGFTPSTGEVTGKFGVTTGGITFNANPTYDDWGADVDQAPNNTKELKRLTQLEPTLSGTFLSTSDEIIRLLMGGGAKDGTTSAFTPPAPMSDYASTNGLAFTNDLWWVGDTSNNNGFIAIHMKNALNQSGFQLSATKDNKAQYSFEFHAHYSLADTDDAPFEIYFGNPA